MKLVEQLPEPVEYEMDLSVAPEAVRPGQPVNLTFVIRDPWKRKRVASFAVVHEKLFHMFIVGEDLEFFLHDHPVLRADHAFHYDGLIVPRAGMYRLLGDFYPLAATPQLAVSTILVAGNPPSPPAFDLSVRSQDASNMTVHFRTVPERVIAAVTTQLHFKLPNSGSKAYGLEKYLGAWGHMLVASDDKVDLIHTHPFLFQIDEEGGPAIQFNVVFPRPGHDYRVWVQFQREGIVNTVRFDVHAWDVD